LYLKDGRWNRPKDKKRREDSNSRDEALRIRGRKFAMKGVKERIDLTALLGSLGGGAQFQGKW
jgi:hypothetical protein